MRKLLIANRGEIACRIITTARRLGIQTVAVYSTTDRRARHVQMADEAWLIGEAAAAESYLRAEKILEVAQACQADAIHPGYGFLAENTEFARLCESANIRFVGPTPDAIDAMGSKSRAKAIMAAANVPLLPGYHGDDSDDALQSAAEEIGYPVLLKAVAGGGGKGMRIVASNAEFTDALAGARREATAAFGDATMLVEKFLDAPRHVELQVVADTHGNVVHLFDRDCSIQRRYQKIIEEAPAPGLSQSLRDAMAKAGIEAAKAIQYQGAGTIEFLVDGDQFYFMEMNTRLQVEHPVSEMITGIDLVAWQLRIADGEPLPRKQAGIAQRGHAIEARVYAEDPANSYLPTTGTIDALKLPQNGKSLRIDHGLTVGDVIGIDYDPMLAKVIAWAGDRSAAREQLLDGLAACDISGVTTNLGFLHQVVSADRFGAAELSTGFLNTPVHAASGLPTELLPITSACAQWWRQSRRSVAGSWHKQDSFQSNLSSEQTFEWLCNGDEGSSALTIDRQSGLPTQATLVDAAPTPIRLQLTTEGFLLEIAGRTWPVRVSGSDNQLIVSVANSRLDIRPVAKWTPSEAAGVAESRILAPMSARVLDVRVSAGQRVAKDEVVMILEAMKMEQTLRAPAAGQVVACDLAAGDLVAGGTLLLELEFADPKDADDE